MAGHSFDTFWWLQMSDAAMNARRVCEIEQENPSYPPATPSALAWHRSCSVSAIILAAAALESYANDVFLSPFHQREDFPFDQAARAQLKSAWAKAQAPYTKAIERMRPLEKINVALTLARQPPLHPGHKLYQDCVLAVMLRDAFAHSKTRTRPAFDEPFDLAHDDHKTIEKRLVTRPFGRSPYYMRTAVAALPGVRYVAPSLFPYGCYDHGCVEWAIKSHLAVMRHVEAALNLEVLGRPGWHESFDTQ